MPTSKPTTTSLDLVEQPVGVVAATATLDAVETTSTPAAEPTEQAVVAPTPTPTAEVPATADLTVQPTEQATVAATPTRTVGAPVRIGPAPTATASPAVTLTVQPTATPGVAPSPTVAPLPSPESATRIEGPTRWERSASPILVERDVLVAPGASLQIDPGVEVRFKPGTSLIVQGQVLAAGVEGTPVRFVATEGRWNGLAGHMGSVITLEYTEVRQAGQNGVALSSTGGQLVLRNVLLTDGGGSIVANGAAVEMRNSQVTGNDLSTDPALSIWIREAPVTLRENIIGGNQTPQGTPQVRLVGGGIGPLDVQGNAFVRGTAPLVEIQTSSAMGATIRCNDFREGTVGLLLNAFTPNAEGFSLAVDTNAFERQPVAGITSTVTLEAGNNWWGDQSGPADAQRNPEGHGVPVGPNVNFQPILEARPDCAPVP